MKQSTNPAHEDDFALMLEESFSGMKTPKSGQLIETQVMSISKDSVFVRLSGKSEGILDRDEFADEDGNVKIKVGDPIKVFFLHAKNGEMRCTTRLGGERAEPSMLEEAFRNKIPVDGIVEKEIKGGFEVKIGDTRAFCPYSQMGPRRAENAAEYLGKRLTFKIMEYREGGRSVTVSNRAIHEEAHQNTIEELKKTLHEGMVVKAPIVSIQDFGAFVDLQGVQALVPVSEIARTRVDNIRSVLTVGQEIEAVIQKIDWKNERIGLSMKSLLADPWDEAVAKYPEGTKHTGKVVRVTDFGAFVTLEPGLDGLLHVSLIRAFSNFGASRDLAVKLGQTVSVEILSVDKTSKRISLKLATSAEEDETTARYMETPAAADTYNPFAALLKKK